MIEQQSGFPRRAAGLIARRHARRCAYIVGGVLLAASTLTVSASSIVHIIASVQQNSDQPDNDVSLTFNSDQSQVPRAGQVELSWTSVNAETCEASGDWSGPRALSGTFTTPPLTADATYRLTCLGDGTTEEALLTVQVTGPTIRWQAPDENVDGTPFTDLAGFNIYWGNSSGSYGSPTRLDADAREFALPPDPDTYYIAVTTINAAAEESGYSNEIRMIIQ